MTELQPAYRKDLIASIREMILLTDSMTAGKIESLCPVHLAETFMD